MSSCDQETIRINIEAYMPVEALQVCDNISRANKYFNLKTLQNIIKIILVYYLNLSYVI